MGKGTRQSEIRQRRHRQLKRRKDREHQLTKLLSGTKTREERRRVVRELADGNQAPASDKASG